MRNSTLLSPLGKPINFDRADPSVDWIFRATSQAIERISYA